MLADHQICFRVAAASRVHLIAIWMHENGAAEISWFER